MRPDPRSLADHLALDRTVLANERTLLAYVRTTLGLLGGGVAVAHFIDDPWLTLLGWALALAAPVVLAIGVRRYQRVRARLLALDDAAVSRPAPGGA